MGWSSDSTCNILYRLITNSQIGTMTVSSQPSSVSFVYLFVCPFLLLLFDKYISWQRNGMGVIPMTGCCLLLFVLGINFWRPGTTSLYPEVSILDLVIIRLLLSFTALYLVCQLYCETPLLDKGFLPLISISGEWEE